MYLSRQIANLDNDSLLGGTAWSGALPTAFLTHPIVGFGNPGVLVSLATTNGSFAQPTTGLANSFNPANGWTNNDLFHRAMVFGNGSVLVSLATGRGTFAAPALTIATFDSANGWIRHDTDRRLLGDVNGDGMSDIDAFENAEVLASLATGSGNFASRTLEVAAFNSANGWTNQNDFSREPADVNGDWIARHHGLRQWRSLRCSGNWN